MPLTPVTKQSARPRRRKVLQVEGRLDHSPKRSRVLDSSPESPKSPITVEPSTVDAVPAYTSEPLPVTIVTFGHNTPSGREFLHQTRDTNFQIYDCRDALPRNPSTMATPDDGSSTATQISVFEQEHYGNFIAEAFDHVVMNDDMLIAFGCHSGKHRADTAGRHVSALLNSLFDEHGHRIFNAMHFKIGKATPQGEVTKELSAAKEWSVAPWALMASVPPHIEAMYGYEAAVRRPAAYEQWLIPLQSRSVMFPWLLSAPRSTLHSFPNDSRSASTDLPTEYWCGVGGGRWWRCDSGRDTGGGKGGPPIF
jgi:hypothetical protein